MKRILAVLILMAVMCASAKAANTGAAFLKIGTSARAVSMGEAFTSVANDISAVNYNPAGISFMNKSGIAAQHTEWITDIRHDFFGLAVPSKIGVVGVSAIHMSQGALEGRDANREYTGEFGAYDTAVAVSFARKLAGGVSGGLNLKVIRQNIESEYATGVAVDLGGIYRLRSMPVSFGLSVKNLGAQMKFINEGYDLPLSVAGGVGYSLGGLIFALDVEQEVYENRTNICIGTEYMPVSMISLRAGYLLPLASQLKNEKITDNYNGVGAGVGFRMFGTNMDYAFIPYGDLGNTHRLSFTFNFR